MNISYQDSSEYKKIWYVSAKKREFGNIKNINWPQVIFANAGRKVKIVSVECTTSRNINFLEDYDTI